MPTYEYKCNSCSNRFEVLQKIIDNPLRKCPKCGNKIKRLIGSGSGIIFKGSGFYATDYRSESYKKREKEEIGKNTGKGQKKKEDSKSDIHKSLKNCCDSSGND